MSSCSECSNENISLANGLLQFYCELTGEIVMSDEMDKNKMILKNCLLQEYINRSKKEK
jgi:hypothetical protein